MIRFNLLTSISFMASMGWIDVLKSNAGLGLIGALIGGILTWSANRFTSKKSVESIYVQRINDYMEKQDKTIEELEEEISSYKDSEVNKNQEIDHLRSRVRDQNKLIIDLQNDLIGRSTKNDNDN